MHQKLLLFFFFNINCNHTKQYSVKYFTAYIVFPTTALHYIHATFNKWGGSEACPDKSEDAVCFGSETNGAA